MTDTSSQPYRVLARKYRPATFAHMIGQDALVQTLNNAIALGRLAHAFILTGVRGVGKTSTARILAKGLNCEGADGAGGPTMSPCGQCGPCRDINDGRHIDVLEMDAASNTGVDDVRDIIDGAAYRPVSARFKIYIIDEVHMLSRSAFNALLKTLEEPPDNVKFIFATTEIRKVPVTILSRCQRFDLRRVPVDVMRQHLSAISEQEGIKASGDVLAHIAKASEGSVRDALSLLDQAAAMSADDIAEQAVLDMLGQANTDLILNMLQACLEGKISDALALYSTADAGGAEADVLLADMLDMVHLASLMASGAENTDQPETQRQILADIAKTGIARLGRAWQVLLAGHRELRDAPNPKTAAQMVLIRLAHIAPMPTPAEIIKSLPDAPHHRPDEPSAAVQAAAPSAPVAQSPAPATVQVTEAQVTAYRAAEAELQANPDQQSVRQASPEIHAESRNMFSSLQQIAACLDEEGEKILAARLRKHLRPVSLSAGKLEVQIDGDVSEALLGQLARFMSQKSGQPWLVSAAQEQGGATLAELDRQADEQAKQAVAAHPVVKAVLDQFEGAEITAVRPHSPAFDDQLNDEVNNA